MTGVNQQVPWEGAGFLSGAGRRETVGLLRLSGRAGWEQSHLTELIQSSVEALYGFVSVASL